MKRIGTELPLTEDERNKLAGELQYWCNKSSQYYKEREREQKAFDQIWDGQSCNGLRVDTDEEEAWPFDGASDQRVRWGDTAFQEYVALMTVALDRCKVEVECSGTQEGATRAAAVAKVLKWCRRKLGADWYVQVMALLRYVLVDTPAVAAMDVGWMVKKTMGVAELDANELEAEYAAAMEALGEAGREAAAIEFRAMLEGEAAASQEPLARWLVSAKKVREKDAGAVIEALAQDGECEALVEAEAWEGPYMKALRYGDDFMLPPATEDFDTASPLFRQEWIGETELRERAANEGWDEKWVEETLKHKGANLYDTRDYESADDMKDMVNLVWCYTTSVDAEGATTRYVSVLSLADGSAFGKRVVRARRGKWQTVFFRREVLANNCLASRGLAHICCPDQGLAKQLKDSANNNAIISCLPMIKAKGARVRNVMYEPFRAVPMGQNDDLTFMQPPAYPAAAKEMVKELKDDLYAYLGLTNGTTDVTTRTSSFTAFMLAQFCELMKRLVEAAQDYASDEALMSVTGEADTRGVRHEDLDGDFQLSLKFDPANMDHKDLIDRVTALGQIIAPLDAKNEIDRGPVLRNAFAQLFPECYDESFRSSEEIVGDDIKDEEQNFMKLKAGLMPAMDTEGKWNYQARLEWHQRMAGENPDAIEEMSPRAQENYQRWLAALRQMATQFGENAEIGRTGVEGVKPAMP